MKVRVITVGKLSQKNLGKLYELYLKRLGHYFKVETLILKKMGDLSDKILEGSFFVVLDERGKNLNSEELATWIGNLQNRSISKIIFLLGPAEGIPKEIIEKADFILSLSRMTLQHEQAYLILLEQIYRACTLLRGEPYHK